MVVGKNHELPKILAIDDGGDAPEPHGETADDGDPLSDGTASETIILGYSEDYWLNHNANLSDTFF